jgi:hypothetical protein
MKHTIALIVFFMTITVFAQDEPQEEQEIVTETSCSLSIKTNVYPVDSTDKFGKVAIEALLTDNKGNPLPDQKIQMTVTNGTLSCMPPVSFNDAEVPTGTEGCLTTQEDGTIKIYLVHIPFNRPGKVKAFCVYGNFKVSALGAYSITKWTKSSKSSKKKSSAIIKKRIPMSGEVD